MLKQSSQGMSQSRACIADLYCLDAVSHRLNKIASFRSQASDLPDPCPSTNRCPSKSPFPIDLFPYPPPLYIPTVYLSHSCSSSLPPLSPFPSPRSTLFPLSTSSFPIPLSNDSGKHQSNISHFILSFFPSFRINHLTFFIFQKCVGGRRAEKERTARSESGETSGFDVCGRKGDAPVQRGRITVRGVVGKFPEIWSGGDAEQGFGGLCYGGDTEDEFKKCNKAPPVVKGNLIFFAAHRCSFD